MCLRADSSLGEPGNSTNVSETQFSSKLGDMGLLSISGGGNGGNSAPCWDYRSSSRHSANPGWILRPGPATAGRGLGLLSDMGVLAHVPLMCCPW